MASESVCTIYPNRVKLSRFRRRIKLNALKNNMSVVTLCKQRNKCIKIPGLCKQSMWRSCESGVGRKRRWGKGPDVAVGVASIGEFDCIRHVNPTCITLCNGNVVLVCIYN